VKKEIIILKIKNFNKTNNIIIKIMNDLYNDLNNFDCSDLYSTTQETNNQLLNLDIEKINNNKNHYLCTKCFKFPYIKFCKDRKYIRLTCSCFNNKKILIKDLYEKKILSIENNRNINLLSSSNLNDNIENKIICKNHNEKFSGFSKMFMDNYCQTCINIHKFKFENDIIIKFDDIKIENIKIEQLLKKINYNDKPFDESNNNTNIIIDKNNDIYEILSKEEEEYFKNLINIIINDYKNYPNFSHFFNIKNLLYFFNIENIPIIGKEIIKLDNKIIKNDEQIIIEYNNNISYKTQLFSKTFVKNNKKKFKIEIEGERKDLIEKYEFKTKEKKVRIKLFINNGVSEINMYKMFSNCIDLIYVDGISKLKKKKIINMDKLFYNCISLIYITDFNEWEIEEYNKYLMFYNCISLIFFPYEKELNINKYDESLLGIIITRYLKFNKEIIIKNINEDNEGYTNLFGKKYKIKDKEEEIMIIDGKETNELIACYKDKKIIDEDEDTLITLNKNNENGKKIKIRIINKVKDMNEIIKKKELDLSKWNTNNVTDMSYLFYNCSSLSSLPDISKWNTNNATNMSDIFSGCSSLSSLPDISNWNTINVINMSYLFSECSSLISLPDISKWNTNNVKDMRYLFYNCSSLLSLPDISKWNTSNVTNMIDLFSVCSSLSSLPDISKWNMQNVTEISQFFYKCSLLSCLPNISKWNTNNFINISGLFYNCSSLLSLPDISKWRTNNVNNMRFLFYRCSSLSYLPDISKWSTNNVTSMSFLFYGCSCLSTLPDISKWNINNVEDMFDIFSKCSSLSSLPDISKWNTNNGIHINGIISKSSSLPDNSKLNDTNIKKMKSFFDLCFSLPLPYIFKFK